MSRELNPFDVDAPRKVLEKRFDDFDKLHCDLKEIEPGMCRCRVDPWLMPVLTV